MSKNPTLDPLAALAASTPLDYRARECRVVRALKALDEARAATLRHLIEESGHSAPRIAQACKEAGVDLTKDAIQVHRRKDCQCPA